MNPGWRRVTRSAIDSLAGSGLRRARRRGFVGGFWRRGACTIGVTVAGMAVE
jgi:hypothetical protein